MIPEIFIRQWSAVVPWQTTDQIEQDLIICRALIEIFSDELLSESLMFRGGTALHKLYLDPQPRYSEDIDLVQIKSSPIKGTIQRIQHILEFIGHSSVVQRKDGVQIKFYFESEIPPIRKMRLKVEINTREHFNVLGLLRTPFEIKSLWHHRSCLLNSYRLEELLGMKFRALYQRSKGRDLYDLYHGLKSLHNPDSTLIMQAYHAYMNFSVGKSPGKITVLRNIEEKIRDDQFTGDTKGIITATENYDPSEAFDLVKSKLIDKL